MAYLGDDLNDYWSFQLLDAVIDQLERGDAGDIKELEKRLETVNKKFAAYKTLHSKNPKELNIK